MKKGARNSKYLHTRSITRSVMAGALLIVSSLTFLLYGSQPVFADLNSGLVGHWRMDESSWNGTPGEVVDSSGNGNHGTASGGATTQTGIINKAGIFDGVNDSVSIPTINLTSSSELTIQAWVKPNNITTNRYYEITRQGKGVSPLYTPDWLLSFQEYGTVLSFGLMSGGSYAELDVSITASDFTDGEWHHIVAIYNGIEMKLYHNDSLMGTISKSGNIGLFPTSNLSSIGSLAGKLEFFNGLIDDIRIYSRAITEAEISELYNYNSITLTLNQSCPSSVQARFTVDSIGLVQSGSYPQSFATSGVEGFTYSVVMNEDAVNIENTFGGEVTLIKPDTSTVVTQSARAASIDPVQNGTYRLEARALNGDLCDVAEVTITPDPVACTVTMPEGVNVTTVSGGTNVETTPVCGTNDVYIRDNANEIVAKVTANLNSGLHWGAFTIEKDNNSNIDNAGGYSIVHYPGGASNIPGIVGGSFVLYVPREAGDTYVRVCPGASQSRQLSKACVGGVNLPAGTTGQYTVTAVTLESRDLWQISGVTGTGGLGIQEGNVLYIDLDPQPATLPSTVSTAPEVAVSTADEFYISYIPTGSEFEAATYIDVIVPQDWSGLSTCASSTTDADGDTTTDGSVSVINDQIIRYTFSASTTQAITTGVEFCFAVTTAPTPGNYSIAMSDTNDGDYAPALIYVGDANDVTVTASIPITLSLRIKEPTTTSDTNQCDLGVLNPGSVNSCSYRIAGGTNISTGMQVFIFADNQLNTLGDASDINDTVGGNATITAGVEEHGIILNAGTDWTVGGSFSESTYQSVPLTSTLIFDTAAAISDSSEVYWNLVTHSASVSSGTLGGSYDQLVTYRAWVDT